MSAAEPRRRLDTAACVAACAAGQQLVLHRLTDPPAAALLDLACLDAAPGARRPKFPGPNPVSLDSSHFASLRAEPYVACEKTDGVRMLLVCLALGGGVNLVALVDRALAWYVLPLRHVPKAMFQGSLLDGELAWNKARGAWEYLVFDAVCVSGIPVLNCALDVRVAAAERALAAYRPSDRDPVAGVRVKRFVPCGDAAGVRELVDAAQREYDVDGLILTPCRAPVVYGRHAGMFKLKFGNRHTVDFLVGRNGRDLLVFDHGRHACVAQLAPNVYGVEGSIVECEPAADGWWAVVGVRTDKTTANDRVTYEKTLLNMREKLTWDSIAPLFAP